MTIIILAVPTGAIAAPEINNSPGQTGDYGAGLWLAGELNGFFRALRSAGVHSSETHRPMPSKSSTKQEVIHLAARHSTFRQLRLELMA